MEEHILVGLSSAPSNARIIRTAATMAAAFGCKCTALFVRTPGYDAMSEENKARLHSNTELPRELGVSVETVFGDDVSYQIAEYARLSGVTKIVVGRSAATRKHPWSKPTLTEKLTAIAPNLDIHIIPDASVDGSYRPKQAKPDWDFKILCRDWMLALGILALATVLSYGFSRVGFTEVNIIAVYLLATLLTAMVSSSRSSYVLSAIGGVLLSILGECALALENSRNAKEKEEAKLQAENEKLRANLLRSISHDLRTPLTTISGNASILLWDSENLSEQTRKQIYRDIHEDAAWLHNLVENLLAVTRIDEGRIKLRMQPYLMEDIVAEALQHISRNRSDHPITVRHEDELLLASCDSRLIIQTIVNLVDNAIKYTPAGTSVEIRTRKEEGWAVLCVTDNGPGISDEEKSKIFQMFYTGSHPIADSRRSLGLGLSLCKSILTAHGGEITVSDNRPSGTVFTITIPSGEVEIHE